MPFAVCRSDVCVCFFLDLKGDRKGPRPEPNLSDPSGIGLKIESRRAILVDPYFALKSPGHDVILTSLAANLW